ncbi:MAG: DUF1800 domain-containing protein [Rhodobacteraceae bacterium]|nr:DUF1800 domain-containing protein [Paracoccaceae bacterium]
MSFTPELAEIRFGCGLSPDVAPPGDPAAMLQGLTQPDTMAQKYPITGYGSVRTRIVTVKKLRRQHRKKQIDRKQLVTQLKNLRQAANKEGAIGFTRGLQRWVKTEHGFFERLVAFWGDHFTAMGKNNFMKNAPVAYIEEAIRPNITGQFADLLIATTTHPLMLHFLDQAKSVGPGSKVAARSKRLKGLNENLAREVMELHTLGVGGPYSQGDVRQLAELFTGMNLTADITFRFRADFAEPGRETVLGRSYGGDPAKLEPVLQSLRDLAVHPATARHIARKLAVHFVSDNPDPDLVQHIEAVFNDTAGNLLAISGALLEHPASWEPRLGNVKPPFDFIASATRALAPDQARFDQIGYRVMNRLMLAPLDLMGQPWNRPGGPDGWNEQDEAWITPQGVSARLRWALSVPQKLRPRLPDPDRFVTTTLGSYATQPVIFAARTAESRSDAIGLVLAAPAFQRR